MHGENVRQVQVLLIDQGYLKGQPDGMCGERTVAAIKSFQQAVGLAVDGVCGPATYAKLSCSQEVMEQGRGQAVTVVATAYSAQDIGNSAQTATGLKVRHGIIAVDPDFIPLGTRVFIPGYGEAVAADVGGGIHGNIIDIAFDLHSEAMNFGRRDMEIYLLD